VRYSSVIRMTPTRQPNLLHSPAGFPQAGHRKCRKTVDSRPVVSGQGWVVDRRSSL